MPVNDQVAVAFPVGWCYVNLGIQAAQTVHVVQRLFQIAQVDGLVLQVVKEVWRSLYARFVLADLCRLARQDGESQQVFCRAFCLQDNAGGNPAVCYQPVLCVPDDVNHLSRPDAFAAAFVPGFFVRQAQCLLADGAFKIGEKCGSRGIQHNTTVAGAGMALSLRSSFVCLCGRRKVKGGEILACRIAVELLLALLGALIDNAGIDQAGLLGEEGAAGDEQRAKGITMRHCGFLPEGFPSCCLRRNLEMMTGL